MAQYLLLGQTVIGKLTDRVNPTIELRVNPVPTVEAPYTPNTFMPANFVEQTEYFMVQPKPQEYVNVNSAICREQLNDTTFIMVVPKSEGEFNPENLPGAFKATVKNGYWTDMSSFNPENTIRENYGYTLTGIVRALEGNQLLSAGVSPDDAGHSPVSDKWELYIISATETMSPVVIVLGDVNEDGLVNIVDVTVLINYMMGSNPQPFNELNADMNADGGINITDVTALINMVMNMI